MAFGDDEAQSVIERVGDPQDMRVKRVIDDSLTHSNFICLDFKAKAEAQIPAVEEPPVAPVSHTHDVSMTYEISRPINRTVDPRHIEKSVGVNPVDPRIVGRLADGGNIMMGCAEHAANAVEIQMGAHGEVATRQVLVRLDQSEGKNYTVVEKLSPQYPTEIFREDAQGNISPVQAPGNIARIEIPADREVTVKIGLGLAPHLQLPSDGMDPPSESERAMSRSVVSAELPDLAVEMSKYRFGLTFSPRNMVTHEQPREA